MKVVLFDNQSLGLVGQQQDLFFRQRFACDYRHAVDFLTIARGFGWEACDLAVESDPHQALADALASSQPTLVRVPLEARAHVFPMVRPGSANTDMILEAPDASAR